MATHPGVDPALTHVLYTESYSVYKQGKTYLIELSSISKFFIQENCVYLG